MIVNMTLQVTLTLPDGSASMDGTHGRGWVLPNGQCVKPFAVYELNDERDLTYPEAMSLGLDIEDIVTEAEIENG
jgi:hypothetical protein